MADLPMKKIKTKKTSKGRAPARLVPVEFAPATVMAISIVGTFSQGPPEATSMTRLSAGRWFKDAGCHPVLTNTNWRWMIKACQLPARTKPRSKRKDE